MPIGVNKWIVGALIAVSAAVIVLGFALFNTSRRIDTPQAPLPLPTQKGESVLPEGWVVYKSVGMGIEVSHPSTYTVQENEGYLSIYKWGPTQATGTEIYDGASMTISTGEHSQDTLEAYVEDVWAQQMSDPIYMEVGTISRTTIAQKTGFEFESEALGRFRNIYLPRSGGGHFLISIIVEDPGNLGFEDEIGQILDTLQI